MDLFRPYRVVEESDEYIVYECKTIYVYLLYFFVVILAIGFAVEHDVMEWVGIVLLLLYFCLVSTQYMWLSRKMKRAALEFSVEFTGSKWSFAKPLRMKIPHREA